MERHLQTQAYNFDRVLRYSLYAALIFFVIMLVSTLLIRNIHPLWNAVVVIGFPYSLFVSKIKSRADDMIFEENQIIVNGKNIAIQDIEFFRIFDSLRLYFVLRITKTGQQYIHYLPVLAKQDLENYFEKERIRSRKGSFDFIARYYCLLYVLHGISRITYSLGTHLYYYLHDLQVFDKEGNSLGVNDKITISFEMELDTRRPLRTGIKKLEKDENGHPKIAEQKPAYYGDGPSDNIIEKVK